MPVTAALGRWLQRWQRSLDANARAVCWVGFSGGMDSTVLLHGMAAIRPQAERPLELRAAHLDHALDVQVRAVAGELRERLPHLGRGTGERAFACCQP